MLFALFGPILMFVLWLLIPVAIIVLLVYVRVRLRLARKRAGQDTARNQPYQPDDRFIEGAFIDESGDDENQQTP